MGRDSFARLTIFLALLLAGVCTAQDTFSDKPLVNTSVTLKFTNNDNLAMKLVSFAPVSNVTIEVNDIASNKSFVLLQVHTYQYNVTLSYDNMHLDKVSNRSIFGSNMGLYLKVNLESPTLAILKNDNVHRVDALLVATAYDSNAPVPGGCNMEFDTEIAPYKKLLVRDEMIIVDTQPASVPVDDGREPNCEKNPVKLEMYRMYLPEQDFSPDVYFEAIGSMLTVEDVRRNGHQIPSPIVSSPMRYVFSAYKGIGSIYVAVATYRNYSSAYIPAFTYACSPVLYLETCHMLPDTFSKVLNTVVLFVGFFLVFLGHRCPIVDRAVPVYFVGCVIGYTAAISAAKFDTTANVIIAASSGMIATVLWLICTCCMRLCQNLVFGLILGYLYACISYFCAPGAFLRPESDWIFWTIFTVMILIVSIVVNVTVFRQSFTCAVFGSYIMILAIDFYAGSNLKYIIINVMRRTAIPGFNIAIIDVPFQEKEVCLIIAWVSLVLYKMVKQYIKPTCIKSSFGESTSFRAPTDRTPLLRSNSSNHIYI
ncbi:hypothetical protein KM043_005179 [Ampulex compressa]|nr:hypothetical protein KM043_005179 [Ampulex compressa]